MWARVQPHEANENLLQISHDKLYTYSADACLIHSPTICHFDPAEAISLWNSGTRTGRARRPETLPYGKRDSKLKSHFDNSGESESDSPDELELESSHTLPDSDFFLQADEPVLIY